MVTQLNEMWKDIPNYEGLYQVSNIGRIRGVRRQGSSGAILKHVKRDDGYLQVSLRREGKSKSLLIHRLVTLAFLDEAEDKPYVNHIDGDKANNFLGNLEFCTSQENAFHKFYVLEQIIKPVICVETGIEYPSVREAGRQTGIGNSEISKCCRCVYRYKTAGGYHWKFKENGEGVI